MSTRAGYRECWPPTLTWEQPAAWDELGRWCEATVDWLMAKHGPPPARGEASQAADTHQADRTLDLLLAEFGFERAE